MGEGAVTITGQLVHKAYECGRGSGNNIRITVYTRRTSVGEGAVTITGLQCTQVVRMWEREQ